MSRKLVNTSKNRNNILSFLSILGIRYIYRKFLKPMKARYDYKRKRITICSFYPSCSEYGIMALKKYGFFKGWVKTINRIFRCNKYRHVESCIDYP